jgi:hypothetical protein
VQQFALVDDADLAQKSIQVPSETFLSAREAAQ